VNDPDLPARPVTFKLGDDAVSRVCHSRTHLRSGPG
jgi:hypothetical protein